MRPHEKAIEKISLLLMIVTIVLTLLMLAISPVSAAPNCDRDNDTYDSDKGKQCDGDPVDPDDSDPCIVPGGLEPDPALCSDGGGGDGGDTNAPDPYNLARASFNDFPNESYSDRRGISADGQAWCTVQRPDSSFVTYDYWAWQEALLGGGQSIHDQAQNAECVMFDNRSDVSGGGRWFLITTAGPDPVSVPVRWLVFDFSNSPTGDSCPNLDGDDSGGDEQDLGPIYLNEYKNGWLHLNPSDNDPCVDHLTVRLPADRILKSNATEQKLEISIRYQPVDSIYWPPWGGLQYLDPVHIRAPSDHGPFAGRDCTVMSTRPAPTKDNPDPEHDKMMAELYKWDSPSSGELVGTYNMPFEVCVIRTSD